MLLILESFSLLSREAAPPLKTGAMSFKPPGLLAPVPARRRDVSGCGCRATQLDLRSEAAVGGGSPPLADAMTRKLRPSRGRSRLTAHSGILLVGEEHLSSSPSSLPSSMGCGWGMPILCCCSEGWYGAQGAAPACSIGKFSTSAAPPLAPCCVEGPGSIKLPPQWFSDSHCERPSLLLTREERWGKDDDEVAQVPTSSEGGCWLALLSLLILNLLLTGPEKEAEERFWMRGPVAEWCCR